MRVVADTNILVSALQFGGKPKQLRETFDRSPEWLTEADRQLRVIIRLVETTERLRVIGADPSDDRIPECAAAGRADVIVSGDVHLLRLGNFRGVPIQRVAAFLDAVTPATPR